MSPWNKSKHGIPKNILTFFFLFKYILNLSADTWNGREVGKPMIRRDWEEFNIPENSGYFRKIVITNIVGKNLVPETVKLTKLEYLLVDIHLKRKSFELWVRWFQVVTLFQIFYKLKRISNY